MANITLEGYEELVAKLTTLEQMKQMAKAVKAAATHVKGKIATYPPVRRGPQPFKTDKSRRYFFWALRNGKIDVPYRRGASPGSETLGRKWTISAQDSGLTAVVGNNVSYGRLVQGESQTGYHKTTGWKTTEQVADEERETVVRMLVEEIERIVGG